MLALCMIVKDEEKNIERVLNNVKDHVDEIVIVDTGSKDNTKILANRFGAKIFDLEWKDDFAAARNFGVEKVSSDWVLWLDADELLNVEDLKYIRKLINKKDLDCYSVLIKNYTDDITQFGFINESRKTLFGKEYRGYVSNSAIRLFKKNFRFVGPVHEYLDVSGARIGKTDIVIEHELKEGDILNDKQLKYLKIYEENIDVYPNKGRAYQDLGILYMNHKKDFEKAIDYFNKSIEINDKNIKAWVGLGMANLKINDFGSAKKAFSKAWELNTKDNSVLFMLARTFELNGDYEDAIKAYDMIISNGYPDVLMINKKIDVVKQKMDDDDDKYQVNVSFG